jgi:hypothetical protein
MGWREAAWGGMRGVEEALHKRALWGVPRALREWDVIEVRGVVEGERPCVCVP